MSLSSNTKASLRSKCRPDESATTNSSSNINDSDDQFAIGPKMSGDGREPSKVIRITNRAEKKGFCVVARCFFGPMLSFSDWPCLAVAQQDLQSFFLSSLQNFLHCDHRRVNFFTCGEASRSMDDVWSVGGG